jgi:hypothetical protein
MDLEVSKMCEKKYLPLWTDGLNYDEQHLTYWIANNMERINQNYSLLPIRLGCDYYCERKRFDNYVHTINDYFEKGKCRVTSKVVPASYYVAEKAFDLAAEEFFKMHPEALDITFHELNENGVYNTKFSIDYTSRIAWFQKILDQKIDELRIIDDVFELKKEEQERHIPWPEYSINALLDINEDDIYYGFPNILRSYGFPYVPKKQVEIKKEDVYKYFLIIPENIFVLGNQYIKYNENEKEYPEFFEAAKSRDLNKIKEFVRSGMDINTIGSDGKTAFSKYIGSAFDLEKEKCNIDDLKALILLGANPAIYGAGFDEDPLSGACLDEYLYIVDLLLESGVNPHLYPCIDEVYENISETLLERTERWADGDLNVDGEPSETQRVILNKLLKYA